MGLEVRSDLVNCLGIEWMSPQGTFGNNRSSLNCFEEGGSGGDGGILLCKW